MSRKILGLDIRNDAVSAVLIKSGIKGNWIAAHEHVSISDQKEIETSIASALETITKEIDTTGSVCIASFPADQISYRNIQVPFKEMKKIRQVLPFELEPTMPYHVEDLIIDFQAIKLSDQTDHTDLITAAVEKSSLKSYLDILASFKIKPDIITVGGYPLALCLANNTDITEKWLLVDIHTNKSTIFVIIPGQICLIRSFPISMTSSLRTESLCTNIQRTLNALEEILRFDFEPNGVFITGSGISDVGFKDDMARILGLPVHSVDFVRDSDYTMNEAPAKHWIPALMDNAFALALIEIEGTNTINFRKSSFVEKKYWAEHKKAIIKTSILLGLVLALVFGNIIIDSHSMRKKLTNLNSHITQIFKGTFPDVKKIVDPLQQMKVKIQEERKKSLFPLETKRNILVIDILNEISKLISKETDVEFTRLLVGQTNILISGNTDTFNSVDDMKNLLEQAGLFQKVTISSANINKSGNRVRFKLKVQL